MADSVRSQAATSPSTSAVVMAELLLSWRLRRPLVVWLCLPPLAVSELELLDWCRRSVGLLWASRLWVPRLRVLLSSAPWAAVPWSLLGPPSADLLQRQPRSLPLAASWAPLHLCPRLAACWPPLSLSDQELELESLVASPLEALVWHPFPSAAWALDQWLGHRQTCA